MTTAVIILAITNILTMFGVLLMAKAIRLNTENICNLTSYVENVEMEIFPSEFNGLSEIESVSIHSEVITQIRATLLHHDFVLLSNSPTIEQLKDIKAKLEMLQEYETCKLVNDLIKFKESN